MNAVIFYNCFSIGTEDLQNRILIVKYEDLIKNPDEMAIKIYNFMGAGQFVEV